MRKQYMMPTAGVYEISMDNCLMAGSTTSVTVANENFDSESMTPLARENGGLWDDDEE